jgi:dephospho-CoA kinase
MDRDKVSREDAEELLNVQMPDQEKVKRGGFVLSNNGSAKQLISSVDRFYEKFLKNTEKPLKVLDSQDIMF